MIKSIKFCYIGKRNLSFFKKLGFKTPREPKALSGKPLLADRALEATIKIDKLLYIIRIYKRIKGHDFFFYRKKDNKFIKFLDVSNIFKFIINPKKNKNLKIEVI